MNARITQALLRLAGHPEAEFIAGDLSEEFALVRAERNTAGATRWFAWQLARSLARPVALRLIEGAVVIGVPLAVFQGLWSLLFARLCLLPLDGMLAVNGAGLCAGALTGRIGYRIWIPILLAMAGAGLATNVAAFPYVFAAVLAAATGRIAIEIRRRMA